jgi:hypothetical protein
VSSVERLLADGYWKDDIFTRFSELDLKAIEEAFAERVLAQLHKQELITDDDVASTSSAEQSRSALRMIRALAYLSSFAQGFEAKVAFIQDEHSIKDIMKSQGIPNFLIRRSLGVVGQAPPPIPKFIDRSTGSRQGPVASRVEPTPDDF